MLKIIKDDILSVILLRPFSIEQCIKKKKKKKKKKKLQHLKLEIPA